MGDELNDDTGTEGFDPEAGTDAGESGADDFEGMLAEELGDSYVPPGEEADESPSDDGEDRAKVDPPPEPRRPRSEENVVRRLQASEERVLELQAELKAAREAKAPVKFESSGDLYEDVVALAAVQLGCGPDDPRIRARLFELGGDMLAELNADSEDPKVRERLEKRAQLRREREIQRQIDGLKAESRAKDRQLEMRDGHARMSEHLRAAKAEEQYPHLYAAEDDPVAAVFQGIAVLVESGHRITDANAADTIAYVCDRIDADHRARLERLEAARSRSAGGKPPVQPTQQRQTRGPLKDGARSRREDGGGRTVTASGVGSRQPPAPKSDVDQNPEDLFEQMLRDEREERRRLASQRRR